MAASFRTESDSSPARPIGEFASGIALLFLMGVCVCLLILTVQAGRGRAAGASGYGTTPAVPPSTLLSPQLEPHLFIIVVGERQEGEYRALLEAEASLREGLHERQRNAEVIAAAGEVEALAIAGAIANIPGSEPVNVVVVK